jgi:selenocysteine lyase/cysteine desulfurase
MKKMTNPNIYVVSFNIKGISPEETGYILEESFGIVCRSGLHCAPLIHKAIGSYPQGCVRISFSCFNKKKEVDSLINAVTKIIKVK